MQPHRQQQQDPSSTSKRIPSSNWAEASFNDQASLVKPKCFAMDSKARWADFQIRFPGKAWYETIFLMHECRSLSQILTLSRKHLLLTVPYTYGTMDKSTDKPSLLYDFGPSASHKRWCNMQFACVKSMDRSDHVWASKQKYAKRYK